jgi:hypothetical protein
MDHSVRIRNRAWVQDKQWARSHGPSEITDATGARCGRTGGGHGVRNRASKGDEPGPAGFQIPPAVLAAGYGDSRCPQFPLPISLAIVLARQIPESRSAYQPNAELRTAGCIFLRSKLNRCDLGGREWSALAAGERAASPSNRAT